MKKLEVKISTTVHESEDVRATLKLKVILFLIDFRITWKNIDWIRIIIRRNLDRLENISPHYW